MPVEISLLIIVAVILGLLLLPRGPRPPQHPSY